jgi:holo-[acyl-carrier protein] synthase
VVVGIGIDLCDVGRMRRALTGRSGARFVARVFTDAERSYCEARRAARIESYAARFAAKEAAMKALGTGWGKGVGWHDVEVVAVRGEAPALRLHGGAARRARAQRVARWLVTLTHTTTIAAACVVAEGPVTRRAVGAGRAAPPPRRRR